jgi:colicin import membrane protein
MTTATFDTPFDYGTLSEAGLLRSVLLAAVVHGLLFAFLFYGLRWQSEPPGAETVELYVPPPAPATVPVVEPAPPKPQPVVEKDPEPNPVQKPDIAVEKEKPKKPVKPDPPKAKAEPKALPKTPPLDNIANKAARELSSNQQKSIAEKANDELNKPKGIPQADESTTRWRAQATGKAHSRMRRIGDLPTGTRVLVTVDVFPDFGVKGARVVKSSGNPEFDSAAVEAAISASPYPVPENRAAIGSSFNIEFKPQR